MTLTTQDAEFILFFLAVLGWLGIIALLMGLKPPASGPSK